MQPQPVTVTSAAVFVLSPVFNAGQINLTVTAPATFTPTLVYPTGDVQAGTVTLNGSLFTPTPVFATGDVQPGAVTVTGVAAFAPSPTFPTGVVSFQLAGVTFTPTLVFPTGDVQPQAVTLNGALFTPALVFPLGEIITSIVVTTDLVTGTLVDGGPTVTFDEPRGPSIRDLETVTTSQPREAFARTGGSTATVETIG